MEKFTKITEQPSLYDSLEKKSVHELLTDINHEDQKVALVVEKAIPQIEASTEIGRAVQQECRDRSRMPSSA